MYTFSYFKVFDSTCRNLDSIVRNFWWGHDQGVKKLHMVHWDKLCQNRKNGGIGFKKFNLTNQAMLAVDVGCVACIAKPKSTQVDQILVILGNLISRL